MKINLKAPIQLPIREKTILRPGVHDIPNDVFAHWFIQGKVHEGVIDVIADGDSAIKVLPKVAAIKARIVEVMPASKEKAPEIVAPKLEEVKPEAEKPASEEEIKPEIVFDSSDAADKEVGADSPVVKKSSKKKKASEGFVTEGGIQKIKRRK